LPPVGLHDGAVEMKQGYDQDGNKLNNCPGNLVLCYHAGFNPAPTRQCPFTGRYLTVDQYRRLEAK
jgi:hypothetical protein